MACLRLSIVLFLLSVFLPVRSQSNSSGISGDPLQYVDTLIGSTNGGNVFPGANIPYGVAKAVADTDDESNQGGFTANDANITGFSSMHDSGTGGEPSLGNFALFPYASCPGDDIDRCVFPKIARKMHYENDSLKASPGYFTVTLNSGVNAEMTAAQHTSLFRFNFPGATSGNSSSPLILMDLTDLSDSRQDNSTISVDPDTGRMTGGGRFLPSFAQATYAYDAYFCADFHGADIRDNGIFVNSRASASVYDLKISRSINNYPLPGGGWIRFNDASSVLVRVGLSFISSAQACSNAEAEIPSYDFDGVRSAAVDAWRKKLSPIKISTTGVNSSLIKDFYSGIYRAYVNPQNYTGENPKWQSSEPYWDSFYCIWDLFRATFPFLTITDPEALTEMIRALLDIYTHEGWMPDCRMTFAHGYTQGGSNADIVLADAYQKGLMDNINWDTAYAAVIKDATVEPYDWCCRGRGGLDSWNALGYIPVEDFDYKGFGTMTRSISRTLEYSYNDFTISRLASGLGHTADVQKYVSTSGNWKNLFRPDEPSYNNGTNTGFVGFFQPKYLNRTWGFQDPLKCSNIDTNTTSICSLQNTGAETFESSIWEYGFFVPHDMGTLITDLGGPSMFVKRLDFMHDQNITYIGNEPAFLTVYQYHYAGRPALSAKRAHFYIPRFFRPTRDGLPGNDDSGTMGSFVALSMIGLFPNPGQNVYFIIPPFFEAVNITSPLTGKTARIRNVNFDPEYNAIYIQSATLDGKAYTKNWIDHSFFTEGKELVLTLGRNETSWGTRTEDLPPSLGHYTGTAFNSSGGSGSSKKRRDNVRYERSVEVEANKPYWGLSSDALRW